MMMMMMTQLNSTYNYRPVCHPKLKRFFIALVPSLRCRDVRLLLTVLYPYVAASLSDDIPTDMFQGKYPAKPLFRVRFYSIKHVTLRGNKCYSLINIL